jgi:hypothetical protein
MNQPLRQAQLRDFFVQIGDVDFGRAVHAERGRIDLDLSAGLLVGIKRSAGDEGTIGGGGPIGCRWGHEIRDYRRRR